MDGMLQFKDSKGLLVAVEMGRANWRLAMARQGETRKVREVVEAADYTALSEAFGRAKVKLGVAGTAPVALCYEAGREGFDPQRQFTAAGYIAWVVDAGSIEVPRARARRVKTDRVDAEQLLGLLQRFVAGDGRALRPVRIPSREDEDLRQLPRERRELQNEVNRLRSRMQSLLFAQGWHAPLGTLKRLRERLAEAKLGEQLWRRLERELERLALAERHLAEVERAQRQCLVTATAGAPRQLQVAAQLSRLRGLDAPGSWVLSSELLGWRHFENRRQVGGLLGATPTPYQSGDSAHEQGISRAGNRRARAVAVDLAWVWLRYQAQSALAQWYKQRFAAGSKRLRKIGIVALTRRLVIALWRYVEFGEIPAGAELKPVS